MRVTLDIRASAATVALCVRELRRQLSAMRERYPEMQERGAITGKEAERRLFAQEISVMVMEDLGCRLAEAEAAADRFGPRGDE